MDAKESYEIINSSELIYDEAYCKQQLHKLAENITDVLKDEFPIVVSIMGGAVVFTGQILPLLTFPLLFDCVIVTRYHNQLVGSEIKWLCEPRMDVKNRTILILDDLLDEGHTLQAVKDRLLNLGAKKCYIAVFADKEINKPKPIKADFIGLSVPNQYIFGYGMDVHGLWRNSLSIRAIKEKS